MGDKQAAEDALLNLQVPCPVETRTLEELATCMYSGGTMELSAEMLLPMLQLADAIQVGFQVSHFPIAVAGPSSPLRHK